MNLGARPIYLSAFGCGRWSISWHTVSATKLGHEARWPETAAQIPEENQGGRVPSPCWAARPEPSCTPAVPWHAGPTQMAYVVFQVAIAARLGQQQLDDLHVPVLAGTHQGGGALIILDVDISTAGQQALHHVYPPVTDRQHEGCLSCLRQERTVSFRSSTRLAGCGLQWGRAVGRGGAGWGRRRCGEGGWMCNHLGAAGGRHGATSFS